LTSRPLRIVFAGTPDFSVPALDALHAAGHSLVAVYTQPDRPAGRGRTMTASPVKQRALALGLPVEQPATLRHPEAAARLAGFAPDLMVVVAYGLILPQPILDVPWLGCLNIHASLLPRWRGAAPIQRAILAGDLRTGITIMKMDAGLDTGPMLLGRETAIGRGETGGQLHDRLARLGAEAVVTAIEEWTAGRLVPQPQPAEGATYAAKLRKDEAVIDWTRPAAELERLVLAFNPWPVAETCWRGQQLRVWRAACRADAPPGGARPGKVIEAADGRILVATGLGTLRLDTLQLPGRKPTAAADFLKANALAGCQLGQTDG
jgi:methionyl-tRNA formyltransferase